MEGLLQDALEVFTQVPRHGAETGGILLGRMDQDVLVIQDFAPVPSEHRFGRLYRLSDLDRRHLRAACDAITRRANGMEVVGLYRTHARTDRDPSAEDAEYLEEYPAEDRRVMLIVRPGLTRPTVASFYFWSNGGLVEPIPPAEFPFHDSPAQASARTVETPMREFLPEPTKYVVPAAPPTEEAAAPKIVQMPSPPPVLPAPAPRLLVEERGQSQQHWFRWVVIAWLFAAAVATGYFSRELAIPPPPTVATPPRFEELPSTPAPPVPAEPPKSAPAPAQSAPAPAPAAPNRIRLEAPPPQLEVRAILDRWADAIRQGRIGRAADFYAPAARARGRASIAAKLGSARRMDVFRLSDVTVDYSSPGEAVARLRQHWQSGVVGKTAGEQSVRLTFRNDSDGWQIVSEDVETVHWIQKVR